MQFVSIEVFISNLQSSNSGLALPFRHFGNCL